MNKLMCLTIFASTNTCEQKKRVTIVVLTTDLVHECEYSRGLQVGNKVGLDPTPTLNLCEFGIGFGLVKK